MRQFIPLLSIHEAAAEETANLAPPKGNRINLLAPLKLINEHAVSHLFHPSDNQSVKAAHFWGLC